MRRSVTIGLFIAISTVSIGAVILVYRYRRTDRQVAVPVGIAVSDDSKSGDNGPVAKVKTIPLSRGSITETLTVYGTVIPCPDDVQTFSVPFECLISRVLVNHGQLVQAGRLLLKIEPAPTAQLQLEKAQSELDTAQKEEELLRERVKLKLATRREMVAAKQKSYLAERNIQNMKQRGIVDLRTVRAVSPGIVYQINVQQGQITPPGTNLLQMVNQEQIIVRVGIESEDIAHLYEGQPVYLKPIHATVSKPILGHIRTITHQVDTHTRLVNVLIAPEVTDGLLLNDFVEVKISEANHKALIAPRSAVLPDDSGHSLFTVEDGRAVKHNVKIGIETARQVEVICDDIRQGDQLAVLGNYELSDGMAVVEDK